MKRKFKLEIMFAEKDSAHHLITEDLTVADIRIIVCVLEQIKLEMLYDIINAQDKPISIKE